MERRYSVSRRVLESRKLGTLARPDASVDLAALDAEGQRAHTANAAGRLLLPKRTGHAVRRRAGGVPMPRVRLAARRNRCWRAGLQSLADA